MENVKQKPKYTLFSNKALLYLIVPIIIESALSSSLGMVDGLMASHVKNATGDNVLSAITAVDQISSLLMQLFTAFGVGGAVITSQLLGAGKVEEANESAKQLVAVLFLTSLAVMAFCLGLNHQIINLLFDEAVEETKTSAYTYFYIIACSFPFIAIFNACSALLRAQRKSMNTMLSGIISFILNVGFNALFIYVLELGIAGVALGTLIARVFPAFFTTFLMTRKGNLVRLKIFEKFRFNGGHIKQIIKLGIPSGIESSLFQLGKILVIVFISIASYNSISGYNELGEAIYTNYETAANSVANNINSFSSMVGSGVNTATLTVIGQAVGTGDIKQVKYYIKKMLLICFVANACCVGATFALSSVFLNFYDISGEARAIAKKCLIMCLSFQFVTYPLSFGLPAVLKANSDMKYVMAAAVSSMLLMRVGLCYILTCDWVGAHMGAMGLWIGMVADWVMRSLLFGGRILSGRWKKSSGRLDGPAAQTVGETAASGIENEVDGGEEK